jgi:hypothetical protein
MVLVTMNHDPANYPWIDWELGDGRLMMATATLSDEQAHIPGFQVERLKNVLTSLTERDILTVRLYEDVLLHPRKSGIEKLPDFDETFALIRDIGPSLRGVMVGNQLTCEVSYRHAWGSWRSHAQGNCRAVTEFIRGVGEMFREIGVAPVFGAMDWEVIQDAYHAHRVIRQALIDVDAVNYVACLYTCVPGAWVKPYDFLNGDQLRYLSQLSGRGFRLAEPHEEFPVLREYLEGGPFWAGLGGIDGVRRGNVETLTAYGVKAFATKLEPADIETLKVERGEWWKW